MTVVARFRARQPTDDHPVPIVTSPRLAAAAGPGGVLPLDVATSTIVGRVVGVVRRLPTVDENVVMADGPTLATALNTASPGSGTADELGLLYSSLVDGTYSLNFNDIQNGGAGSFSAKTSWDFVTGIGSTRGLSGK